MVVFKGFRVVTFCRRDRGIRGSPELCGLRQRLGWHPRHWHCCNMHWVGLKAGGVWIRLLVVLPLSAIARSFGV